MESVAHSKNDRYGKHVYLDSEEDFIIDRGQMKLQVVEKGGGKLISEAPLAKISNVVSSEMFESWILITSTGWKVEIGVYPQDTESDYLIIYQGEEELYHFRGKAITLKPEMIPTP